MPPILLKKLLMTPEEMADEDGIFLEWHLWQRRLAPYHELEPGIRVVLVDGAPGDGTIAWEVVVSQVEKGQYTSIEEAFELIEPLTAGTNVDRDFFTEHKYTAGTAVPGYLLAWIFKPVRQIGVPRRPEHVVSRHGWGRVDSLTIGGGAATTVIRRDGRSGQGRLQDPVLRELIELTAMRRVHRWLRRAGWTEVDIRDTSKAKPYDYEVGPVDAPAFRVEVKGTQGLLGPVIVTAGEVNAARDDSVRTVLAIVHEIEATLEWNGTWTARGGRLWRDDDWHPDDERLAPLSYTYTP